MAFIPDPVSDNFISFAGIYTETPYDVDDTGDYHYIERDATLNVVAADATFFTTWNTRINQDLPAVSYKPVHYKFYSKLFNIDSETLFKRIRSIVVNIFSHAPINITLRTIRDEADNPIDRAGLLETWNFDPTIDRVDPQAPYNDTYYTPKVGTRHNRLTVIPSNDKLTDDRYEDWNAKPIKFSVEIEGELYTNLNQILINIRPIHSFLS